MIWRFTILDRNNVATVIDEPIGWDSNVSEIKRDPDWHGIFFNNQGDTFQFGGKAMALLEEEKNQYGVEGNMTLIMEEDCGNGFEEFSRGRFNFSKFEYYCGDDCYVKVPVENTSEIIDLRNRINQKVNLEATKAFDEVTDLVPYDKLPFSLELPSKGIFIEDRAEALNASVASFEGGFANLFNNGDPIQIEFGLPDNQLSEIGSFQMNSEHSMDLPVAGPNPNLISHRPPGSTFGNGMWPLDLNPIVNNYEGSANYDALDNPVKFEIVLKGSVNVEECYMGDMTIYLLKLPDNSPFKGEKESDYEFIAQHLVYNQTVTDIVGLLPPNSGAVNFNFIFNQDINIEKGDRFYLFLDLHERKTSTEVANVEAGANAFTVTLDSGSYIKITNLSHTAATVSKVFAINETISRIAESVTNNKLRAYSDYFGRTDSQPYAATKDGCGSMEVITDGLRIRRQENKTPGQTSVFSQSLQDIFNGLAPIHNIGLGIEPDPNRSGFNRLRVESWRFFYNDTVVMNCTGIDKITRKTYDKDIFSTFQFGYNKWEAEEYNGLDEFLTKRNYRTTLSRVKNDLSRLSTFIASGYAIEITRRKGNTDTKDWRYDKDTFIICIKRNAGDFKVELGNVQSPVNIIDPDTVYNYRISPIRNAMRWMNRVLESYKQFDSGAKIIFTDGDGNYFASGEMEDGNCKLENAPIAEDATLDPGKFSDSNKAKPFATAERILYNYPMSSKDYKVLEANPYGLIYFENDCDEGFGWIDTISYTPEEGAASFTLIPAIDIDPAGCLPVAVRGDGTLPSGLINTPYTAVVNLVGTGPFTLTNIVKPSWLAIYVSGTTVYLSGTPIDVAVSSVSFDVSNCDGMSHSSFASSITIGNISCDPVTIPGAPALPDGYVNTAYNYSFPISGDAPFSLANIVKPGWMTIKIVGNNIVFSGTPAANISGAAVSFRIVNCNGIQAADFSDTINITTVCVAASIIGSPVLPDGQKSVEYNYSIALNGTAPFTLSSVVKPAWMTITVSANNIVFSGTPDTVAAGVAVSFHIDNCTADSLVFSDSIDVVVAPGGSVLLQTNSVDNADQTLLNLIDSVTVQVEYTTEGNVTFHVIAVDGGDANG